MARADIALAELERVLGPLTQDAADKVRDILARMLRSAQRISDTAARVAYEAETAATTEEARRKCLHGRVQRLERELQHAQKELAGARLREKALARELEELRREIGR